MDDLGSTEEDSAGEEQLLKVQAAVRCSSETQTAEYGTTLTPLRFQTYGSEGLQLVDHSEVVLSGQTVLQLTFDPGAFGRTRVTARCLLDHPFYVKNKGGPDTCEPPLPAVAAFKAVPLCLDQAGRHFTPA